MKLEKFDLEKALNGAKVVTRDGREVSQLTKFENLNDDYPLIGVVDRSIRTWTTQGLFVGDHTGECDEDLFLAVEPQRKWVNVYYLNGKLFIGADQYNYLTDAYLHAVDTPNMQYIKTIEITDEI
jgi:hypothetical protein